MVDVPLVSEAARAQHRLGADVETREKREPPILHGSGLDQVLIGRVWGGRLGF